MNWQADDNRQARFDAGRVGVMLLGRTLPIGREFYVAAEDLDAVVALLKKAHTVFLDGREEHLPNGTATLGGYPTGRDHAATHPEIIARRRIMTIEQEARS